MSTKYKFRDQNEIYHVTFTVINWIDVFIRNEYKEILITSWKHCIDHKGLEIYGWCIMTSHVHMIIGSNKNKLEDIVRDMKKHTSEQMKYAIRNNKNESRREWMLGMMQDAGKANNNNANFQFWIQNSHPIVLDKIEIAWQRLEYIHNNPIVTGFVDKAEEYVYSSARDYYYDIEGKVPIKRLNAYVS
ncbi:MAG: transposase [Bacteroidetes bacterium]|nr:transposase [Bacteroidota bacterium]